MRAYVYGHVAEWRDGWVYEDTGEIVTPRPCPQCGQSPTPEGYDACLGEIPGALGACCGHGLYVGYVDWLGHRVKDGWLNNAKLLES